MFWCFKTFLKDFQSKKNVFQSSAPFSFTPEMASIAWGGQSRSHPAEHGGQIVPRIIPSHSWGVSLYWGWSSHPTFSLGNPYNGYIKTRIIGLMSLSPIIYGNNGSLDPIAHVRTLISYHPQILKNLNSFEGEGLMLIKCTQKNSFKQFQPKGIACVCVCVFEVSNRINDLIPNIHLTW